MTFDIRLLGFRMWRFTTEQREFYVKNCRILRVKPFEWGETAISDRKGGTGLALAHILDGIVLL